MSERAGHGVSFGAAVRVWAKIGLHSFGGPAGQIAVMHRVLVEEKKWIGETRFLHALNYCMLLPGPEAMQLATYVGWLMHRTAGGLAAGILFVLPGFVAILGLSLLYAAGQGTRWLDAVFFGLKAAVLAVVLEAVLRIGRRALGHPALVAVAACAFVAIFFFAVPFPAIIGAAALVGVVGGRMSPRAFSRAAHGAAEAMGAGGVVDAALGDGMLGHAQPSAARAVRTLMLWLSLWLVPVAVLWVWLGPASVYTEEAVFFGKAAVVTFGGAYAVLAYVAQQAVEAFGWLNPGEMLDGLGMAETTPGPLIMVVQFVGFLAAFRDPGGLNPMLAGTAASVIVTWVTFVPCFLWIFLGAPYIEAVRGNRLLTSAMTGVTAAVVGVILNLAVWFGIHTLFSQVDERAAFGVRVLVPLWSTLSWPSLILAGAAALALVRLRIGMIPVLLGAGAAGAAWRLSVGS